MKKLSLLLLAMLSLSLVNCKKDKSDDSSSTEDDKKPVPVTVTSNQNSSRIQNFPDLIIKQITGAQSKNPATITTTTNNYEYNGRHTIKITSNDGTDVTVADYYYADMDNGILDSIVYKKNGQFTSVNKFEVSNGHLQQITNFDDNNQIQYQTTFSNYVDGKPQQISIYAVTVAGALNLSGTLTYNGNDLTGILTSGTWGSDSATLNITYTHDTKNNVFLNVETLEWPTVDDHNIISMTNQMTISGMSFPKTTTYTYTYNSDDFPITSTYTATDSSSGSSEYVYDDK